MCNHNELVFLGYQEIPGSKKKLALFNCTICKTTLAYTDSKHAGKYKIHKNQEKVF